MKNMRIFEKYHIANGTTTLTAVRVKQTPCTLRYVTINTKAAGITSVYDTASASATTNLVAALASNAPEGTYRYDCGMTNGIRVDTNAAVDLTVCYEVF